MRIATGFAFALASVGSALYFMPSDNASKRAAEHVAKVTETAASGVPSAELRSATPRETGAQPRVFSADRPLVRDQQQQAIASSQPVSSFIAPVAPKLADPGQRKLSSSRPADDDARRELVRDLQRELKRVGCFEGEATGTWGPSTKRAMTAFTERVNATLPLEEPDYILLTLVQGHGAQACGKSCPSEQAMNEDGKCLPRAIVAQKAKRSTGKVALAEGSAAADAAERPSLEKAKPRANAASQSEAPRVSTAWSTVVTEAAPATAPAPHQQPALPGRMAIGAPIEAMTPSVDQAEVERTKAEVAKRKIALLQAERSAAADADRQRRVAEAEARRANDLAKKAQLASLEQAARATASASPSAPAIDGTTADNVNAGVAKQARIDALTKPQVLVSEKRVKQGQVVYRSNPPAAVVGQTTTAYRVTSPRFVSPPYGVGRIASVAPRPSYAPEPRRWTRTIFTDITRLR